MDLIETLRTTGAIREFTSEPVPRDVLYRVLDSARFAPSGGNRQGWRAVVVEKRAVRERLADLYRDSAKKYTAQVRAGLVAWAPVTDKEVERSAIATASDLTVQDLGEFARSYQDVPVLLVVFADLRALASPDRDNGRYGIVGGASVYPFVWSVLLAARSEGLAGVITTIAVHADAEFRELFHVPEEYSPAAVIALGYPVRRHTKLRRAAVEEFTTIDSLDGPPFSQSPAE